MKWLSAAALMAIIACIGCATGEPPAQTSEPRGGSEFPELAALAELTIDELRDFLKDAGREPALRVEAIRLLVERTGNRTELFPVFLASLQAPTKRERDAALYYLSRFGAPEHIPAIEASAEGMNEHYRYSVKCTINQIRERAEEGEE